MIELIITSAGKKEIVNAQQNGSSAIKLSHIGVGSGKYTATEAQTSLQSETKRLSIVEGGATGDSAIHVALMDESTDAYSVHEIGVYTDTGVLFAVTSSQTALAEKGAASSLLLAIDVAFADLDASVFTFGDLTYSNAAAANENAGVIATATDAEATAGTSTQKAITPSTLSVALNARAATNAEAQVWTSSSAVAGDVIGQIQFLADNGNIDYSGCVQGARAGFISGEVFESSTLTTAGTTNLGVRGIVKICACSDAAGREEKGVEVIDNGFRPTDDNTHNRGTAGRRWKAIYAATDVISTSDRREKRDIGEIPDAVLRAIGRVKFRQYRLKDDPLYYFGVVAQDVIQAFDDEGLDAFDYGVVFIDTLDDGSYRYSVSYRDIMVLEAERKRRFE